MGSERLLLLACGVEQFQLVGRIFHRRTEERAVDGRQSDNV